MYVVEGIEEQEHRPIPIMKDESGTAVEDHLCHCLGSA